MRKNLGSLIFLALFASFLSASTYKWKASASKLSAVTNEAIYLSYSCEFSDAAEIFVIDFNPVTQNENYTIILLSETQKIENFKRINSYEYVAFVHESGEMAFEFDVAMKMTNPDSIQDSVLGRDNEEYEEYSVRNIKQKTLVVNINPSQTNIVGLLDMQIKADEPKLSAYEPYHFEVRVSGIGNLQEMKKIVFEIDGVKVFTQSPKKDYKLTKEGYKGVWSQKFAFVSEKNFTIPKFHLEYFDTKSRIIKRVHSKAVNVEVTKLYKQEDLLDKESAEFVFDFSYIYYLLTFIAGFLLSKVNFTKKEKLGLKMQLFQEKIEKATSLDELLIVLILENRLKYQDIISKIESNELKSIKEAKDAIIV